MSARYQHIISLSENDENALKKARDEYKEKYGEDVTIVDIFRKGLCEIQKQN